MNKRVLKAALLVTVLAPVLAIGSGQAARANDKCKPVNGHLEECRWRHPASPSWAASSGIQGTDNTTLLSVRERPSIM